MPKHLLVALLVSPAPLLAANPPADLEPLPEVAPPPLPDSAPPPPTGIEDEGLEPEVKIIKRNNATIHEYRVNGQLTRVKVFPRVGPPYTLVDSDGDGTLESPGRSMESAPIVPRWTLFSW